MAERTWLVHNGADLGRAVGEIRRHRGMTQEQLAAEGGLRRAWLAKLETGRSTTVLDHLVRLLRRLGATMTVTFDDGGNGPDGKA
jgi:transcriptional regulator with XRE-family HTH domain